MRACEPQRDLVAFMCGMPCVHQAPMLATLTSSPPQTCSLCAWLCRPASALHTNGTCACASRHPKERRAPQGSWEGSPLCPHMPASAHTWWMSRTLAGMRTQRSSLSPLLAPFLPQPLPIASQPHFLQPPHSRPPCIWCGNTVKDAFVHPFPV